MRDGAGLELLLDKIRETAAASDLGAPVLCRL